MVRINLLPASLLHERSRQRARIRLVLVTGMVVLLLAALLGYLFVDTWGTEGRLAALSLERAAVEAETARYLPFAALQNEVRSKSALVSNAMGYPLPWVEVLEEIGEAIPANVWLTDFHLTHAVEGGSPSRGQLMLRGLTNDHPSTARWIAALRGVSNVTGVRVSFSAMENLSETELVRFEIKASLLPGNRFEPLAGRGE